MASLGRSSAIVAAGTLASRTTGLVRNVVLAATLGVVGSQAADAFGVANQLPTSIYSLIAAGLLSGIIVPQIVKAVREHADGGSAFVSKLITLGLVALSAVTVIAVVGAPVLVWLYGSNLHPETQALTLALAYWCLPQLLFYGLYALMGEILNARKVFGPYSWSPVINNIVSIIGFGTFIWLFGLHSSAIGWTPGMVALIGGTATLGIILQALVLFGFWRRAKLRVRLDFHWRGIGLRQIGRLAGWTFAMVIVGQLAALLQVRLVGAASGEYPSVATMQNAWTVFILPYSVVVMSIGTPYYTRISEHATENRVDQVKADLSSLTRVVSVIIVGLLAGIVAAIVPISRIFTRTPDEAVAFALVLGAYLFALIPLALQFGLQRTFYAFHDTRTPFFFTLTQATLVIATTLIVAGNVPVAWLAAGIALGQALANIVQVCLAGGLLRRKLGPLGLGPALRSVAVFVLAALPAFGVGWVLFQLMGGVYGWAASDRLAGFVSGAVIGVVTLAVYTGILAVLRVPEVFIAIRTLRRFLPGR